MFVTDHFCTDCRFWGMQWVKDLMRRCWCPANQVSGEMFLTAMMATCEHWVRKTRSLSEAEAEDPALLEVE